MKNKLKHLGIYATAAVLFAGASSCKKIDTPTNAGGTGGDKYDNGLFISNEGSFGAGNGSVSFYNSLAKTVKNNVFSIENGRPLGDVVQSITRIGDKAFICVNGSNKIEVVESSTFKEVTTITGVALPRYMVANGNVGYVSSWNNGGEIAFIDLNTLQVTNTLTLGSGPERMAISNNKLFVANSGGYGVDSTLTILDLSNNNSTTLQLNAYNPTAIVHGSGNTLWVLARGRVIYDAGWNVIGHDPSKLIELDASNNSIVSTTTLFNTGHPGNLDMSPDKSTLYVGGAYGFYGVYALSAVAPGTPDLVVPEMNYGFFVNQSTGNLFVLQEASSSNGKLLRYSPSGNKLGEYTVGVFPNGGSSRKKY
ncbi:MAG: hypothetical protein KDD41_08655 [Flavobacteriales bacterium]|nr:hypothetical protein [Flavobacteriales bacterium]